MSTTEDLKRLKTGNAINGQSTGFPFQLDTFVDLKAVIVASLPNGLLVNLGGAAAVGDGQGGWFYYSASSVLPGDDVIVVAPTAGAGRWLRMTAYKQWATYFLADDQPSSAQGGGSMAISSALTPNQGYLLGNWFYGGSPADDRFARAGAGPLILFANADSVGEGYLAGDMVFFTSQVGAAGDEIAWVEKMRIRGPNTAAATHEGLAISTDIYSGKGGGTAALHRQAQFSTQYIETGFSTAKKAYVDGYDGAASVVTIASNGGGAAIGIAGVPSYANNAAAVAAGLAVGRIYRNGDIMMIVH